MTKNRDTENFKMIDIKKISKKGIMDVKNLEEAVDKQKERIGSMFSAMKKYGWKAKTKTEKIEKLKKVLKKAHEEGDISSKDYLFFANKLHRLVDNK